MNSLRYSSGDKIRPVAFGFLYVTQAPLEKIRKDSDQINSKNQFAAFLQSWVNRFELGASGEGEAQVCSDVWKY